MSNQSERATPESKEGQRLNLLQLLRVDFEDAKKLQEENFESRQVYIRLDSTEDTLPKKTILLTERGEKLGKSLRNTDRYYVSTIDDDAFPMAQGGHPEHSGLELIEVKHIDDEGNQGVYTVTDEGLINYTPEQRSALSKILPGKDEIPEEEILDHLREVLADYRPTPFPAFDE